MNLRTVIVALAVPIDADAHAFPAIESCLAELGLDNVQIVSVLDAKCPENNYEPQIFTTYQAEVAPTRNTLPAVPSKGEEVAAPGPDACCVRDAAGIMPGEADEKFVSAALGGDAWCSGC